MPLLMIFDIAADAATLPDEAFRDDAAIRRYFAMPDDYYFLLMLSPRAARRRLLLIATRTATLSAVTFAYYY